MMKYTEKQVIKYIRKMNNIYDLSFEELGRQSGYTGQAVINVMRGTTRLTPAFALQFGFGQSGNHYVREES